MNPELLQALVSRHGYQVETAAGVEEALAAIGNRHFDFILCDVRMPGMDGMDFLAKGVDRLHDTTVIMMSAFGSIDTAIEAMKAGETGRVQNSMQSGHVRRHPAGTVEKRRTAVLMRQIRHRPAGSAVGGFRVCQGRSPRRTPRLRRGAGPSAWCAAR